LESYQQRSGGAIFAPGLYTALGAGSPTGSLKWTETEIGTSLTDAKTHDDAATDLAKQAEREYRARDPAMPDVTQAFRNARKFLLVANRGNPKALGDSPKANGIAKPAP
jgi:hypothetical protein